MHNSTFEKSIYNLLIFFFICTNYGLGQTCPNGSITLESQQQIDDFPTNYPGCTEMAHILSINDAIAGDITNLDSLIQLTVIKFGLSITDCDNLNDLSGLSCLFLCV